MSPSKSNPLPSNHSSSFASLCFTSSSSSNATKKQLSLISGSLINPILPFLIPSSKYSCLSFVKITKSYSFIYHLFYVITYNKKIPHICGIFVCYLTTISSFTTSTVIVEFGARSFASIYFAINVSTLFWINLFNGLAPKATS